MSTAAIVGGTVASAAAGIGSAAMSSKAATKAADTQAAAAEQASQLQYQESKDALDWQKKVFGYQQSIGKPWLQTGTGAVYNLARLMGVLPKSVRNQMPQQGTGAPGSGRQPIPGGGFGLNPGHDPGDPSQTPPGTVSAGGNPNFNEASGQRFDSNGNLISEGGPTLAGAIPQRTLLGRRNFGDLGETPGGGARFQPFDDGTAGDNFDPGGMAAPPAAPGPADSSGVSTDPMDYLNPDLGADGSLAQDWTRQFEAPTDVTEQNDPGFQFRLQQGERALQSSAAARGGLLSGGTAKQLARYGQDYGSNEYGNVYNRALTGYQQDYNIFKQNQADKFNRLAALSGMGQVAAGQLSSAGSTSAGNIANIDLATGAQVGANINNAAAARASGYVGSANAYGGALSNFGNLASSLAMIKAVQAGA